MHNRELHVQAWVGEALQGIWKKMHKNCARIVRFQFARFLFVCKEHLFKMPLSEDLIKKLKQRFLPNSTVEFRFRGKDMTVITDKEGNAIQLFIGQRKENGFIKGDRYSRKMVVDKEGKLFKDHWDRKGSSL